MIFFNTHLYLSSILYILIRPRNSNPCELVLQIYAPLQWQLPEQLYRS